MGWRIIFKKDSSTENEGEKETVLPEVTIQSVKLQPWMKKESQFLKRTLDRLHPAM